MNPSAILEKIEEKYQIIISDKLRIMDENDMLLDEKRRAVNEKVGFHNKLTNFTGKIPHNLLKIFVNDHTYRFI